MHTYIKKNKYLIVISLIHLRICFISFVTIGREHEIGKKFKLQINKLVNYHYHRYQQHALLLISFGIRISTVVIVVAMVNLCESLCFDFQSVESCQ